MSTRISDNRIVQMLANLCVASGVRHAVISPGSRNAPLTIAFSALPEMKCYSVVDERSAGFFALGLAQQIQQPVALICTSGSALLNYAPAVAEAYYQGIPLLVLSADRPVEWIDQADGQTIRQQGVLVNFVKFSATLPAAIHLPDEEWHVNRLVHEALFHTRYRVPGPVHLNIPLREPLYGQTIDRPKAFRRIEAIQSEYRIDPVSLAGLLREWSSFRRVLILAGQQPQNIELSALLNRLAAMDQVVVLNESLSNLNLSHGFNCIDRLVATITTEEVLLFQPELLITFDGAVVSKMVKSFLRNNPPQNHWHISPVNHHLDTYQHLTQWIESDAVSFFRQALFEAATSDYRLVWQKRADRNGALHNRFMETAPWSDLKAYDELQQHLPGHIQLHVANSAPIRYVQLFEAFHGFEMYCNRGTSGIDGSSSTAAGAAAGTSRQVVLITGDLSFLYDSNALWNNYLPASFRIVVVNNGGGGIFRFIPGPSDTNAFETFFEASHRLHMQPLAQMFGFGYHQASDGEALKRALPDFFASSDRPQILEIQTPAQENAVVLKSYFKQLNE